MRHKNLKGMFWLNWTHLIKSNIQRQTQVFSVKVQCIWSGTIYKTSKYHFVLHTDWILMCLLYVELVERFTVNKSRNLFTPCAKDDIIPCVLISYVLPCRGLLGWRTEEKLLTHSEYSLYRWENTMTTSSGWGCDITSFVSSFDRTFKGRGVKVWH